MSHTEAITCLPHIITLHSGEERMVAQRSTKVAPWYKHWNCCGWWKGTSRDEATLITEKIKFLPMSYACLKALLVSQYKNLLNTIFFQKFITIRWKGLGLIWRHFWAWLCLTDTLKLSESKYQAGFGVIMGPKSPNFVMPSNTVLYDTD